MTTMTATHAAAALDVIGREVQRLSGQWDKIDAVLLDTARSKCEVAWALGEYLTKAKSRLPHGEFMAWYEARGVNRDKARRAMQIFRDYPQITQIAYFDTIQAALAPGPDPDVQEADEEAAPDPEADAAADMAAESVQAETEVLDDAAGEISVDVEVKPRAGRLSKTDKLQLEVDTLTAERDGLEDKVDALAAQLKVAQETLLQIEWEQKPGGSLGKGTIGDQIHSLNEQLRHKDHDLADRAREIADLKDEIRRQKHVIRKLEATDESASAETEGSS